MPYETRDNLIKDAAEKFAPDAPHRPPAQNWDRTFSRDHILPFIAILTALGIAILSLTLCSIPDGSLKAPENQGADREAALSIDPYEVGQ